MDATSLVNRGILSYRDGLSFQEAILCAKAGFVVRRAGWFWNPLMHVTCIGIKTEERPWIGFENGFGDKGTVPYDLIIASGAGDVEAHDWIIYTYEQFFDPEFRKARHMSVMPKRTSQPVDDWLLSYREPSDPNRMEEE